jgi:16S rRNA (guanine527-N7)-methyltransferase
MNKILKPLLSRAKKAYELKELERLGLTPTLEQRELILTFFCLLFKWNNLASLISKNDEQCLFIRHFCDSLQPLLLFGFKKNARVLDVGAGGGFPSIPIRVFRPDLQFVLCDSNRKKCEYLKDVKKELMFDNIEIYNGRVEKIPPPTLKFDYVISRGLGSISLFAQLAHPLVADDGRMYTFKTKNFAAELDDITSNKIKKGIKISEIAEYDLGNQIFGLNLVSLALLK